MLHLATITAPFFPALAELGEFEPVEAADMPQEYQALLAHEHHMTVTVEEFHLDDVDVRVLAEDREGDVYSRTSLLVCRASGRVVQLGIMRIICGVYRTRFARRSSRAEFRWAAR